MFLFHRSLFNSFIVIIIKLCFFYLYHFLNKETIFLIEMKTELLFIVRIDTIFFVDVSKFFMI